MTSADTGATTASAELGIDVANARRADLDLKVVRRERKSKVFDCTISSPLVDELHEPQTEGWELDEEAGAVVNRFMTEFENRNNTGNDRVLALNGAGRRLWEAAPECLGRALTSIAENGHGSISIQITTEEGIVPWELMRPDDGDLRPFGVRHEISRWFIGGDPLRAAGRPAGDARVAVALDDGPPMAADEAHLVCAALGGKSLTTTSATAIKEQLEAWAGTILHFVCHGAAEELYLDEGTTLTANQVAGMRDALMPLWRESAPVIFLNACMAAKALPALIGPGGLSRSWTEVGAGAVIAPLWSVRDEIAHDVAKYFYKRIKEEPTTRYAEIVRDIRAKAETEQEDSYAAYCYFGSPWASAA